MLYLCFMGTCLLAGSTDLSISLLNILEKWVKYWLWRKATSTLARDKSFLITKSSLQRNLLKMVIFSCKYYHFFEYVVNLLSQHLT